MTNVDALEGTQLGEYHLQERIGSGGMGAVYRAHQPKLQRDVAVKVLSNSLSTNPEYLERFNREARIAASLEHPNIVPFYDHGTEADINYGVMRLLRGGSLDQRMAYLAQGNLPLPPLAGVVRVLRQIASALDYAHSQGVVHRDMKASNIMFDQQGNAFIVDFGIAKLLEITSHLTGTNTALGTPAYMSPEQWRGENIGPAADQYALGIMTYLMLTGRTPFEADNPYTLMQKHINEVPPLAHAYRGGLPPAVEAVFARVLAKHQDERFASNLAFADAFEQAALHNEMPPDFSAAAISALSQQSGPPAQDGYTPSSAPINDDEKLRGAMRVLFAPVYGANSSPLKRQVAYKLINKQPPNTLTDVLLQDLIRGSFAELVLNFALGDTLNALMIHLRAGDAAKVRDLIAQTPIDADALADLLGQDLRSIVSNYRIDLNRRGAASASAMHNLLTSKQGGIAEVVRDIFQAEGETRAAGLRYLADLHSSEARPVLISILTDETSPDADKIDAAALLSGLATEADLSALRTVGRTHPNPTVRGAALLAQIDITGRFDNVLEGIFKEWAHINPRLARALVATFGDETDYDKLLMVMIRSENPDTQRMLAAAGLCMSANQDYVPAVLKYLNSKAQAKQRWGVLLRYEALNTEVRITDFFADRLRNEAHQTVLVPLTPERQKLIEQLMLALIRFGNERALAALGGITGNHRLSADIRSAAAKALERIHQRKGDPSP